MGRKHEAFAARGAERIAIGPGSQAAADRAARLLGLSFPVFGDPKAAVFGAFGYERVLAIVRQSGTVVIGADGRIRLAHRTANPGAALPLERVLAALEDTHDG